MRARAGRVALALGLIGPAVMGPAVIGPGAAMGAGRAAAASPGTRVSDRALTLVSQTTWATDKAPFAMRVSTVGQQPTSGLELQVSVFQRLRSRSAFAASQRGRGLDFSLWSESFPLDQLDGTNGTYPLCVPVDTAPPPGCTATAPAYLDGVAGVYPVQVTLRRSGASGFLAQLVTHLVLVPAVQSSVRLEFALVVPVAATQPLLPNGSRHLDAATVSRLESLGALLSGHDGVAMTMAPDPATLAALADTPGPTARSALDELRRAAPGAEVLGQPFAPVAPYDLVDSGLSGDLTAQIHRGGDVTDTELATPTTPATWLTTGPVDRSTADALLGQGIDRLVVSTSELESSASRLTPAQPFTLDVDGDHVSAVVEDASLESDLAGTDPVLAGHDLLADLAQTYFESPSLLRGVVTLAPRLWGPSRQMADVITTGLATSSIVTAMTLDGLFAGVPAADGLRDSAFPGRRPSLPAPRIRRDRSEQAALAGSVTQSLPAAVSMNDLVLEAEAADLSPARRAAYLSGAEHVLARQLALVSVVPSSVTLTARHARVPISVQSLLPVPIATRVQVSSGTQLEFPGGGTQYDLGVRTLRQQNTTFFVPVTTRGSGSFPLRVTLTTSNGSLVVTSVRLTIKSRVFSGVGIVLSFGALGFLVVWWGRELRKGRRARRARAVDPAPLRSRQPAGASP